MSVVSVFQTVGLATELTEERKEVLNVAVWLVTEVTESYQSCPIWSILLIYLLCSFS